MNGYPVRTVGMLLWGALLCWGAVCAAVPVLDPNAVDFPAASIADNSDLLEAPTGRHGFVFTGRDGHFRFEDGTRARFWGINVAKDSVFQSNEVIDEAVDAIARSGFNLVRLHHLDDEGGLLPAARAGQTPRIDPQRRDRVDYWIGALGRRGIYVYLDLLDFRTFQVAEGVADGPAMGRGAKPYAFFAERLLQLQRQYAREFLFDHQNPYTGLTYAADPTVCMVELCDENGLFHQVDKLGELVGSYRSELVKRWNYWLVAEYENRATLLELWAYPDGRPGLKPNEDPRKGTIGLPGASAGCDAGPARLASRGMFFAYLQREYLRGLRADLRAQGLRVPVSAVTSPEYLPDLWASAQELDYIATNYYFDHPWYRLGAEWQLPAFFTGNNVLRDETQRSCGPQVAAARVLGKPLVLREWGVCWPNESRAAGMLDAVAYACLQDVDAALLFTFDTRPTARKLDYFDVRRDPVRWGLASLCARAFLQGQIKNDTRQVAIAWSASDVFHAETGKLPGALQDLGYVGRVGNTFFENEYNGAADITVASGRTSGAQYKSQQTVISSDLPHTDALGEGDSMAATQSGYLAPSNRSRQASYRFGGTLFAGNVVKQMDWSRPFMLDAIKDKTNLRPIGVGLDGKTCLGLRDMDRNNYVFGPLSDPLRLRVTLDVMGQIYAQEISHDFIDRGCFTSTTGEIIRDRSEGLLWVTTPTFLALAGELGGVGEINAGPLALETASANGACIWQSRDGQTCETSQNWTLKMVTLAQNTGQDVILHQKKGSQTIYALRTVGTEPVITSGAVRDNGLRISLGGQLLLQANLVNGTVEVCRSGDLLQVFCDTPGVRLNLPLVKGLSWKTYLANGQQNAGRTEDGTITWVAGMRLIEFSLNK